MKSLLFADCGIAGYVARTMKWVECEDTQVREIIRQKKEYEDRRDKEKKKKKKKKD